MGDLDVSNIALTLQQYRRLRRIFLRTACAYRFGSAWGPADAGALRVEQSRMVSLRQAVRA
jgi:hypothetical protein